MGRLPRPGDAVKVDGMRSRPYLNGSHGEIVSSSVDDDGFAIVRLFHDSSNPNGPAEPKRRSFMKVRPHRLEPLGRSTSTPGFERLLRGAEDWESARSMSTKGLGSVASSVASGTGTPSRRSRSSHASTASYATRSSGSATHIPAKWYQQGLGREPGAYPTASVHGRMIPQEQWHKYRLR